MISAILIRVKWNPAITVDDEIIFQTNNGGAEMYKRILVAIDEGLLLIYVW